MEYFSHKLKNTRGIGDTSACPNSCQSLVQQSGHFIPTPLNWLKLICSLTTWNQRQSTLQECWTLLFPLLTLLLDTRVEMVIMQQAMEFSQQEGGIVVATRERNEVWFGCFHSILGNYDCNTRYVSLSQFEMLLLRWQQNMPFDCNHQRAYSEILNIPNIYELWNQVFCSNQDMEWRSASDTLPSSMCIKKAESATINTHDYIRWTKTLPH